MSKTSEIWPLLLRRFPAKEYCLLKEVSAKAGSSRDGSADGIAMNLWPSRGLEIIGLEIKKSRGDWLNELKNPAKADIFFKYCDRWYLVCEHLEIIKYDELPATWGLLVCNGKNIRTIKEAPKLTPLPLESSFVASLLKRCMQGMIPEYMIEDRLFQAAMDREIEIKREYKSSMDTLHNLQEQVANFQEASGININRWHKGIEMGEAVRYLTSGGASKIKKELSGMIERIELLAKNAQDVLKEVEGIEAIDKVFEN